MIKHTAYKRYLWKFIEMNKIIKLGMPLAIFAIVGALATTTVVPVSAQEDARRILDSTLSTAFGVVEDPESLVGPVIEDPQGFATGVAEDPRGFADSLLSQFGLGSQEVTNQE